MHVQITYLDSRNNICVCDADQFILNGAIRKSKLLMSVKSNPYIKLWEDRIKEIQKSGNCSNNAYIKRPYFSEKMDKDRMISFCQRMINQLKKNEKR